MSTLSTSKHFSLLSTLLVAAVLLVIPISSIADKGGARAPITLHGMGVLEEAAVSEGYVVINGKTYLVDIAELVTAYKGKKFPADDMASGHRVSFKFVRKGSNKKKDAQRYATYINQLSGPSPIHPNH